MKWLKLLGELVLELHEAGPEFLYTHEDLIERVLKLALADLRNARKAWEALQDEDKLQEIAAKAPWLKSKRGEGEYTAADKVPLLAEAVKAKQGRLYAGNYVYVLSKNGKWVQRYPRGGGK